MPVGSTLGASIGSIRTMDHTALPVTAADLARTYRERGCDDDRPDSDAARAVRIAETNGWIPTDADCVAFRTLNRLVAWVLSEGSIDEHHLPTFVAEARADRHRLVGLFDDLGIDYRVVEDERTTTTRYRPAVHASVLGRLLSVLGAPVGPATGGPIALPGYLDRAPRRVRREFAETYLRNRAAEGVDSVLLREGSTGYRSELASLIETVSGERVTVREGAVIVSEDATRALRA